jgi:hypothetical protein
MMSFPARVFRVLIASPSDVTEEREIAVRTIQEWNDLNASERQLVLLPLRWETHSAPEYGKRPQEIINRQVVDLCDLLVGIFWTRVGSPTGAADSGTVEEIERVALKGRPVMLYFSQALQDPDKLDLDQLAKLREFKKKSFPTALVETYSDSIEFKDKLSRQLEIQLRSLLASESEGELASSSIPPITDIVFNFADPETGRDLGSTVSLETRLVEVTNFDEIPDFTLPQPDKPKASKLRDTSEMNIWLSGVSLASNKNYFRQQVTYQILQGFFKPIRFWLKNRGGVGARDLYIDISIQAKSGGVVVISKDRLPTSPPSTSEGSFGLLSSTRHATRPDEVIKQGSNSWGTQMEIRALQPQRETSPTPEFLIGAIESCDVVIGARIYADTLPEPLYQELHLRLSVTQLSIRADEVVDGLTKTPA